MRAQSASAQELAEWLETRAEIARVYFPGLQSHPQAALARQQQSQAGAVVAFEVKPDDSDPLSQRELAWRVIDAVRTMSITANLGDTRSTITHPATTTHGRIAQADRERAGISEALDPHRRRPRIGCGFKARSGTGSGVREGLARRAAIDHQARAPYNS